MFDARADQLRTTRVGPLWFFSPDVRRGRCFLSRTKIYPNRQFLFSRAFFLFCAMSFTPAVAMVPRDDAQTDIVYDTEWTRMVGSESNEELPDTEDDRYSREPADDTEEEPSDDRAWRIIHACVTACLARITALPNAWDSLIRCDDWDVGFAVAGVPLEYADYLVEHEDVAQAFEEELFTHLARMRRERFPPRTDPDSSSCVEQEDGKGT